MQRAAVGIVHCNAERAALGPCPNDDLAVLRRLLPAGVGQPYRAGFLGLLEIQAVEHCPHPLNAERLMQIVADVDLIVLAGRFVARGAKDELTLLSVLQSARATSMPAVLTRSLLCRFFVYYIMLCRKHKAFNVIFRANPPFLFSKLYRSFYF